VGRLENDKDNAEVKKYNDHMDRLRSKDDYYDAIKKFTKTEDQTDENFIRNFYQQYGIISGDMLKANIEEIENADNIAIL
jgi:hypothetical protein